LLPEINICKISFANKEESPQQTFQTLVKFWGIQLINHETVPKREKLIALLKNSPNNIRFSDICKLLELEGFYLERITGSHHIFKKNDIILVIPVHNKKVKSIYIHRILEIIEKK
jgi:predicted RNA binding protein YcfA (HicA-like mRNA interferase family)